MPAYPKMLRVENIVGNNFSLTYSRILENWEIVDAKLESVKVLLGNKKTAPAKKLAEAYNL